ncbi:Hypothetical protein D9617_23g004910 [Elsinoe fawcettii]|nr:Hypothetical protein D9617_23g004910 [Elsinoe fawcettii]
MADSWPCAQRTLEILNILSKQWKIDLPEEASAIFARFHTKFGHYTEKSSKDSPAMINDRKPIMNQPGPQLMPVLPQQPPNSMPTFPMGKPGGSYWNQPSQSSTLPRPLNLQPQQQMQQMQQRQSFAQPMLPPQSAQDLFPHLQPTSTHSSPSIPAALPKSNSIDSGLPQRGQHPLQYTQTQQQQSQQQPQDTGSGVPTGSSGYAPSPGDMFGGVEQLLRDVGGGPGEWMVRDQSALAWGFGNWDLAQGDPDGWLGTAGEGMNGNGQLSGQGQGQLDDMEGLDGMEWNNGWVPQ